MRRGAHIAIIFVRHQMDYLVLIGFIFATIAVARVELNHSMPGPDAVRQILQVEFANSGKVEARDLENDYYFIIQRTGGVSVCSEVFIRPPYQFNTE
jgi:hypothetical protein